MPLTPAQTRTLIAVFNGQVRQRYDNRGNVFLCPKGIAAALCRRLHVQGYMEDVPGQGRRQEYQQQLTVKGVHALGFTK